MAGCTVSFLAGEHALGLAAIERARALNVNSALAWGAGVWVDGILGRLDLAVESAAHAARLSPLDPFAYLTKTGLALAHLVAGQHDVAMTCIDQSLHNQPRWVPSIDCKIILCHLLGRDEERQEWVARLIELVPGATIARFSAGFANILNPEHRAVFATALRKSGLPGE